MANVHFAVATPNCKVLEHFNDFADPWVQDLVDDAAARRRDGRLLCAARIGRGSACASTTMRAPSIRATGGRLKLFEAGWEQTGRSTLTQADRRRRAHDSERVRRPADSLSRAAVFRRLSRPRQHRFRRAADERRDLA